MQNNNNETVASWLDRLGKRLENEGIAACVFGLDRGMERALILFKDGVSICPVGTENGYGRWECSRTHLNWNMDLYSARFPVNPADVARIEEAFS